MTNEFPFITDSDYPAINADANIVNEMSEPSIKTQLKGTKEKLSGFFNKLKGKA